MAAKKKPNWEKIATEYITGDIAMCPLARKYHVPDRTLKDRARKEFWTQQRTDYRLRTGKAAVDKTAPLIAPNIEPEAQVQTEKVFIATDLVMERVIELLERDRHLDGRELQALMTTIKGAKEVKNLRDALDIQEQKARIAAMEKNNAPATSDGVEIEFIGKAKDAAV